GAITNSAMRVFRNRPHYRFEGRLHEQIAHHLPTYAAGRIEQSSVRVDHYGYLGAVRDAKEKSQRNLELLKAQQAESSPSAFLHFNIGTECAAIGDAAARYGAAVGAGTHLPRIALAELSMRRGRLDEARELLDWCVSEHPDFIGVIDPYATVLLRSGVAPDQVTAQIEARLSEE